jgi:two-component system NtrC family sensor kinase
MNHPDLMRLQLKDVCKLTSASWAILLKHVDHQWGFVIRHGLTKSKEATLTRFIQKPMIATWLAGSLATGRMRTRQTGELSQSLGCERVFVFPNLDDQSAILIGANQLDGPSRDFFRILAEGLLLESSPPASTENFFADLLGELNVGVFYDLSVLLDRVLAILMRYIPCDMACIGLRYGDDFRIEATSGSDYFETVHHISINKSPILAKIVRTRKSLVVQDSSKGNPCPIVLNPGKLSNSWIAAPLSIGKQVIGIVCFLSSKVVMFNQESLQQVEAITRYIAPLMEITIAFTEASHQLEKFALLNELASAASAGIDADEVAKRIITRLQRVFDTDLVSLLLLSQDGTFLQEFGHSTHPLTSALLPVKESLPGYVTETGQPFRIGDIRKAPQNYPQPSDLQSILAVPLKYRSRIIGVLDLGSNQRDAFTQQDEQLLVVIASHLAGLIENVRLHDETRARARNLELLHQVSQQIVGLVDVQKISQTAAELMAERFEYELVVVNLIDKTGKELIVEGVGGVRSHVAKCGSRFSVQEGITGQVYQSGRSYLANDAGLDPHYVTYSEWKAGSEMCVPLREGDRVFGVINVERVRKGAFTESDLLLLEALGGMLTSVLTNALRYQQLQTNYRHLQAVRETAIDISADLDLQTLLKRATSRARELLGAKGAELGLVNQEEKVVEIKVSENPWDDYVRGLKIPFSTGIAGVMAVDGEPIFVPDYATWEKRIQLDENPPFTSVAGVPLKFKGDVIGTLTISNDEIGATFKPEDFQLLELLAPQLAVSVRNAMLYKELQEHIDKERVANDRLLQSARLAAVGEMAAGVAHELNNPLTTVAGFVELVLEDIPEGSPNREDLELVLREAIRAREVVRRLLDFSRPGEGFRVRSDVNDMVSEVVALVQHLAHTSGVELHIELWNDLPWIQVDQGQIKQVLLNLIHNALQAMPRGGKLNIQTIQQTRDDLDWVTIQVTDTGEGIPPEHLGRIFEPFFTTRPPGKGTGLGLAVSFGIIQEHEGVLDVKSTPGEGSTFTIWLPVKSNRTYI